MPSGAERTLRAMRRLFRDMKTISSAFFCQTPYQMLASIALFRMTGGEADFFIIPSFQNAEKYAENIRNLNMFRRVKVVDKDIILGDTRGKSALSLRFGIVRKYFHIDEIGKVILYPDTRYQRMYVSFIPRMAYFYSVKHNIEPELVYYDDGEGSYDFRFRIEPSLLDKIARFLVVGKNAADAGNKLYLYNPELYQKINGDDNKGNLFAISNDFADEAFRRMVSAVFEIGESDLIREKAIILDMIKQIKYGRTETERINQVYERILDCFSPKDTIIKRHPRDKSAYRLAIKRYGNDAIPFEALCTQMDMDSKVLVGVYSTSLVIPKMLLDREPTVILLYKLFKRLSQSREARAKQDMFYKSFKDAYRSPNKFFIPETLAELDEALRIASGNPDFGR